MSDLMLRSATRTQNTVTQLSTMLVEYVARVTDRARREQSGQDMVEYAGVILVISAIIAAVVATGLDKQIASGASSLVSHVLNGTSGSGK